MTRVRGLHQIGWLLPVLFLAGIMTGCSDDDPAGPQTSGDDVPLEVAAQQAPDAAAMIVDVVEATSQLAEGVTSKQGSSYSFEYDEADQRWEAYMLLTFEGMRVSASMWVQYYGAGGQPQQGWETATALAYAENDSMSLTGEDDQGNPMTMDMTAQASATLTGIQSDVRTLETECSEYLAFEGTQNGGHYAIDMFLSWETLDEGLVCPAVGCPSGTVRYEMLPYHMDVVFDGSGVAEYTTYDAHGTPVPSGSGTVDVMCAY